MESRTVTSLYFEDFVGADTFFSLPHLSSQNRRSFFIKLQLKAISGTQ